VNRHKFTDGVFAALVGFSTILAAAPRVDLEILIVTVQTLASPEFEGRRTGTPGGLKARAWIVERFNAIGLEPLGGTYLAPFSFAARSSTAPLDGGNVVGICKGTGRAPETMVISAHYDHLGVRDGAVYHGADDNASGVAVLLAVAKHCTREPFRHDTLFVAFDAEELGLQGAKAFVARPPIARERIALNINLDMVSRGDNGELYAAGTYHWPKTKAPLEAVANRAPIKLLFGHDKPKEIAGGLDDWTNQSDHGPFHAAGIPFVYFGVEDHPDYHKPTDTADKINPTFFRQAAETILDAVIALDAALEKGSGVFSISAYRRIPEKNAR
jgi:Zn-dependent M28 family amino/carboxypeptidase